MGNKKKCFEAEEMWPHFQEANWRSCERKKQMTKYLNFAPFDLRIFKIFRKSGFMLHFFVG